MKKCFNSRKIFILIWIVALVASLITLHLLKENWFEEYIFPDGRDYGMDFFNSLMYVKGGRPYELFEVLYPPLANLFFYFLYNFIPDSQIQQWPADLSSSVDIRATWMDLRTYQSTMFIFMAYTLVTVLLLFAIIAHRFEQVCGIQRWLLPLALTLNYGTIQAIARGNIIMLAVFLSCVFVFCYQSENKIVRELSYICLALAAGLKLYPAIFGILILREKRYKDAARTVCYGVATVVLPMLALNEGVGSIRTWIQITLSYSEGRVGTSSSCGFSSIVYRVVGEVNTLLGTCIDAQSLSFLTYLVVVLLLLTALLAKKDWQAILAATFAMLMYQNQWIYIYCLLAIPLTSFLQTEVKLEKKNIIPFIGMVAMTVPLPLRSYNEVISRMQEVSVMMLVYLFYVLIKRMREFRKINYNEKTAKQSIG